MSRDELDADLTSLGALTDPVRRRAYRIVAASPDPVGRDDVAGRAGIGRTLAAHHLDKLVEVGLLEVSFARRSGRTGPGAGRPAKLYRRAAGERAVSVPPRSYAAAAELLAEAVDRAGVDDALFAVARDSGRRTAGSAATAGSVDDVVALLAGQGYEPQRGDAAILLRNCPFHLLAEQFPPLVCGMNLALIDGLISGAGAAGCTARLDPAAGGCCVVVDLDAARGTSIDNRS